MKDLKIWMDDPWLEPWKETIWRRYSKSVIKSLELSGYEKPLKHSVNSHLYYGVTRDTAGSWIFREWAPNAISIYLIGDMNQWKRDEKFGFAKIGSGNWELILPKATMKHGDLYKWLIIWDGGEGERIPAYATRTVQDHKSKLFAAQLWDPKP
ncbi:MAG: 1,4-alpha-glucan-branching enzyme, partial [Bacteroidales bacterium]|nr:1,4-alpha-glucan-branching enzyme [Bacteroidales bacterium]